MGALGRRFASGARVCGRCSGLRLCGRRVVRGKIHKVLRGCCGERFASCQRRTSLRAGAERNGEPRSMTKSCCLCASATATRTAFSERGRSSTLSAEARKRRGNSSGSSSIRSKARNPRSGAAPHYPGGNPANRNAGAPRFPGVLPPIFTVPRARNPSFTGRDHILERMHAELVSGKQAALNQAVNGSSPAPVNGRIDPGSPQASARFFCAPRRLGSEVSCTNV